MEQGRKRSIFKDAEQEQRLKNSLEKKSMDSPRKYSRTPPCQQYRTFQLLGNKIGVQNVGKQKSNQNLENEPPGVNDINMVRATERYQTALKRNEVLNQYKETVKLLDDAKKQYQRHRAQESSIAPQAALGSCPNSNNILKVQQQKALKQKFETVKAVKEHAIEDLVGYEDNIECCFPKSKSVPEPIVAAKDVRSDDRMENEQQPEEDVFNTAYLESSPQQPCTNRIEADTVFHRDVEMVDVGIQVEPLMFSKSIQVQTTSFQPDEPDKEIFRPDERTPSKENRSMMHSTPRLSYSERSNENIYSELPKTTYFLKSFLSDSRKFEPHSTSSPSFSNVLHPQENKTQRHVQSPSVKAQLSESDSAPFFPPLSEVVRPSTPLTPYLKKLASEYLSNEQLSEKVPEQAVPLSDPIRERQVDEIAVSPSMSSLSSRSVGSLTAANIVRSLHKEYQTALSIGKVVNAMASANSPCNDEKLTRSSSTISRLGDISTTSLDVNLSKTNVSDSFVSQPEVPLSPEQFFELKRKKLEIFEQVVKRHLPLPAAPSSGDSAVKHIHTVVHKAMSEPNVHFYHDLSTISEVDSELTNAEGCEAIPDEAKIYKEADKQVDTSANNINDDKPKVVSYDGKISQSQPPISHQQPTRKSDQVLSTSTSNILVNAANDMSKSLLNDQSFCLLSPLRELSSDDSDPIVLTRDSPAISSNRNSATSQQITSAMKMKPYQPIEVDYSNFYPLEKQESSVASPASNTPSYLRKLLSKRVGDSDNSSMARTISSGSPSTYLGGFPTPSQDGSIRSSAFQPLSYISGNDTSLAKSARNTPTRCFEPVNIASPSSSNSNLSTIRALSKPIDHGNEKKFEPMSLVSDTLSRTAEDEAIFKKPALPQQKNSSDDSPDTEKSSGVSGITPIAHQYETNSASSSSDSNRFEPVNRMKKSKSSKFLKQRFDRKIQEAEKRQYSGSSDEQLSQIFTKTDMFCQSTPLKQNDDMLQGITDEPDLTLIGPEVSLAMRADMSSNERTICDRALSNENQMADAAPSHRVWRNDGNDTVLSQSMISFLDHEKSALSADNNGSFMYLTYQPTSNDDDSSIIKDSKTQKGETK